MQEIHLKTFNYRLFLENLKLMNLMQEIRLKTFNYRLYLENLKLIFLIQGNPLNYRF